MITNNPFPIRLITKIIILGTILMGCAGVKSTVFLHSDFDFGAVEKIALIPFENLSSDQGAALRVTRLLLTELLSKKAVDVIEPGEVAKVLEKYAMVRAGDLTQGQIVEIGTALKVQGLILGSVNESSTERFGSSTSTVVTLVARLVETKKGTTVWAATQTEGGVSLIQSIFGFDSPPKTFTTRKCVKKIIETLIQ